ncbi:protoporphyrinogen oxidase [Condylostylus longicornis]|uniref:protoporphyrinogen oxidase n=1 Tax=Condylostylus longicornis TaxID=2530218 RepID=UPI00244DA6F2|nr:protoporphyrinogen oxidase [Condylostylus longicornis]
MPTILGGGVAGLSAAYYLTSRLAKKIELFEKSTRLGGWVRSESHPEKSLVFEFGPHTIRSKGLGASTTMELVEQLGLETDIYPIGCSSEASKNRMIYVKNNLCTLPSSLIDMFKTTPPFSKPLVSGFLQDLRAPSVKHSLDDESIYNFCKRRFGGEIADYIISSMICGICAGDAKEISVRFIMNDLFEKEQRHGGVLKGLIKDYFSKEIKKMSNMERFALMSKDAKLVESARKNNWSIYSFKNGMETLINSLNSNIKSKGVTVNTNSECKQITFTTNGAVININGKEIETDHIIGAIPSFKLAELVKLQHPFLNNQLKDIQYVDVAVVNLKFCSKDLLKNDAFGLLIPPSENIPILGVIFDSCVFNMSGTVLTVMMGGKWFEKYLGKNPSQSEILDIALEQTAKILHINEKPDMFRVNILRNCIPQYTVGHKKRIEEVRNYIEKNNLAVSLCGAAYDGVGINDVILSAKTQAYSLLKL